MRSDCHHPIVDGGLLATSPQSPIIVSLYEGKNLDEYDLDDSFIDDAASEVDEEEDESGARMQTQALVQERAEPEPEDQVLASMARQRAVMEQMRRAQEAALQEQYEDEIAQFGAASRARQARRAEEEDERRVGERGEPGEELQRVEPGADRVRARGDRPADVDGDLERVGAQLEPVVH